MWLIFQCCMDYIQTLFLDVFVLKLNSKHMHAQLESSNFRFVVVTALNGPL